MSYPRITQLEVEGLRSIESLKLDFGGLRVLIGESGSGKSSIVEALAILASLPQPDFLSRLHSVHGGPGALVTAGNGSRLRLACRLQNPGRSQPLRYEIALSGVGGTFAIERESLTGAGSSVVMERTGDRLRSLDLGARRGRTRGMRSAASPALVEHAADGSRLAREALDALGLIEVHLPFNTTATWAAREVNGAWNVMRASQPLEPVVRLNRGGRNLVSAYHQLRNGTGNTEWARVLAVLRLGLGPELQDVLLPTEPGSNVQLLLRWQGPLDVPAAALPDGALAYLAYAAMYFLEAPTSVLAVDEPEMHLHPELAVRVLDLLADMAQRHPVVITTHSDRLLDAIDDPAASVVLLELDSARRTRALRPDAASLAAWLQDHRGLGSIRTHGFLSAVFEHGARPRGRARR